MEKPLVPLFEHTPGARSRSLGHLVNRPTTGVVCHEVSGGGTAGQR